MSMRIEIVVPTLDAAGMETLVVEMALRLKLRGHEVGVTCVYAEGPLKARLDSAGIRVSFVPLPGLAPYVRTSVMAAHLDAIGPTVVHTHSGSWLKASLPAYRRGVPAIVHTVHGLHDTERLRDLAIMWAGSVFTDLVVAVSHPLEDYLRKRVRIPKRKLRTILNGIDSARFSPSGPAAGFREMLDLPASAFLIGNVARLAPVKDHETLVRAFASIHMDRPEGHLVLIGDGPLQGRIRALVDELGLTGRVHFVGALEDTAPAYRDLDLFVLSSVAEGTSMSILEALASGVPIVATDVGGNGALLGGGAHGRLVPRQSPHELGTALRSLMDDADGRRSLGEAGRSFVNTGLTLDAMLDQYLEVYDEATSRKRLGAIRRR